MAGHVDMARERQHKVVRKDAGRIKRSGVEKNGGFVIHKGD